MHQLARFVVFCVFCSCFMVFVNSMGQANEINFANGVFDFSDPNYIGDVTASGAGAEAFVPSGAAATDFSGFSYNFGEPLTGSTAGLTQADLADAGFPSHVTDFQSQSEFTTSFSGGGLAQQVGVHHAQQGMLAVADGEPNATESRFFLSKLKSQIALEMFATGGSATLEFIVRMDSFLEGIGLIGASEGISFQLLSFDLNGNPVHEFGIEGFYFRGDGFVDADFYMVDANGDRSGDLPGDAFSFTPNNGDPLIGDASLTYTMEFDAQPGMVYAVNLQTDIGLDTFGVGSVLLDSSNTASVEVNVLTPGAGLAVNGVLIPEPAAAILLATAICCLVAYPSRSPSCCGN